MLVLVLVWACPLQQGARQKNDRAKNKQQEIEQVDGGFGECPLGVKEKLDICWRINRENPTRLALSLLKLMSSLKLGAEAFGTRDVIVYDSKYSNFIRI